MKKVVSLVMSVILIIMMIPIPVTAEEISPEETGYIDFLIHNKSDHTVGAIVEVKIINDQTPSQYLINLPEKLEAIQVSDIPVNSTTKSIIQITVDTNDNGVIDENDLTKFIEEIPPFEAGEKRVVDIWVWDNDISSIVHEWVDQELLKFKTMITFDESSEYPREKIIKFNVTDSVHYTIREFDTFIDDFMYYDSYKDEGINFEVIIDSNNDGVLSNEDVSYSYQGYIEPSTPFVALNIILNSDEMIVSDITESSAFVNLDADNTHDYLYINTENPNDIVKASKIFNPGTYEIFRQFYSQLDTISLLSFGTTVVNPGDYDLREFLPVESAATFSLGLGLSLEGYELIEDNILFKNFSIFSILNNPNILNFESNVAGLNRKVLFLDSDSGIVEFELLDMVFDFSSITSELITSDFQNYFSIYEHVMFRDSTGNRMKIKSIKTEESLLKFDNGIMPIELNQITEFNWHNEYGECDFQLKIPELGIDLAEKIVVHGIPDRYEDYRIELEDLFGDNSIDAFGYYNSQHTDSKRVIVYIPEGKEQKLSIYGINGDEETLLSVQVNESHFKGINYDSNTRILSSISLEGDMGDLAIGNIDDQLLLEIRSYESSMGVIDLTTPDGEPFTGNVRMMSMYDFTIDEDLKYFNDAYAHNGMIFFSIETDFVGLKYANVIISPYNSDGTTYANTTLIDITKGINLPQEGIYDLGSAQLQNAAYTGYVYRSDKTTSVSNFSIIATAKYSGTLYNFFDAELSPGYGPSNKKWDRFYLAPLGVGFSDEISVNIVKYESDLQKIEGQLLISDGEGDFYEPTPQMVIKTYNDKGDLLPEGNGLYRSIYAQIKRGQESFFDPLILSTNSVFELGGLEEGDQVTMWMDLNPGSFDHLRLVNSNKITFDYSSDPGNYNAIDEAGNEVSLTVDEFGTLHLDFYANKTQLYGQIKMGDDFVTSRMNVMILDPITRQYVASDGTHTAVWNNGEGLLHGLFSIGHFTELSGEYIISVENPKDTIYYTGTEFVVSFPLSDDLIIELPESRAFGKVQLTPEDEEDYKNNILRVFVNIFDETGRYIKNARVRNDGYFSAGELFEGKYFAKVFVSPYSELAARYATSKMHTFELVTATSKAEFLVPLVETIGKGTVTTPNLDVVSEAWVNIINSQGNVVESIKTNELGEFSIPVLNDGKYTFKALAAWGYFDSFAQEVTILNSTITGSTTLQLTEVQLSGAIYDDLNELTSGTVYIYDALKNFVTTTYSYDGHYATGGFDKGNYFIQVIPDNHIYDTTEMIPFIQDEGSEWQFISVNLKLADYSGRVSNPMGTPVTEGWVHLYREMTYVKSVIINADGTYSIGGIDASGYSIIAESQGQWSKMMTIGESKVNDIALESEQVVQGAIEFEGEVFSQGEFIIYDSNHIALVSSTTNVFGEFTLVGLEAGTYYVAVIMGEAYYMAEMVVLTGNNTVGTITLLKGE